MSQRGYTLIEMVVVVAILAVVVASAAPSLKAYAAEAQPLGAGRVFKGEFRKASSMAVKLNVETAIRFEQAADGIYYYSVYADGNRNGVLAGEIRSGKDRRLSGPFRLDAGLTGVRLGINPGVPAIPPERGTLDPGDPIRFGRSNMLSFSPMGTATPGTLYLAGEWAQVAVRVTGGSARVRLMVFRSGKWTERS